MKPTSGEKFVSHVTRRRTKKPAVVVHYKTEYCKKGMAQEFSNYAAACHFLAYLARNTIYCEIEEVWPNTERGDQC